MSPEYNLARANQERAKARAARSPRDRRDRLTLARIFEERVELYRAREHETRLIDMPVLVER
ncbi:MAG: hypothetical protein J7495_18190 [Sphingomonas sp.]|nr:hypothetical protein [Sphingomonas sp.]